MSAVMVTTISSPHLHSSGAERPRRRRNDKSGTVTPSPQGHGTPTSSPYHTRLGPFFISPLASPGAKAPWDRQLNASTIGLIVSNPSRGAGSVLLRAGRAGAQQEHITSSIPR